MKILDFFQLSTLIPKYRPLWNHEDAGYMEVLQLIDGGTLTSYDESHKVNKLIAIVFFLLLQ